MQHFAPRAELAKEPILARLREVLPASGDVLELASGSGQHVAHFARALPHLRWQPTEREPSASGSIAAWAAGLPNVAPALALDVASAPWPIDRADAVIAIDLIHVLEPAALAVMLAEIARVLPPGGPACLYAAFDRPAARPPPAALAGWTVHFAPPALETVETRARAHGLVLVANHAMPDPERRLAVFRKA